MMRSTHNSGFTLIELVMVIILVGILAVYAAPRLGTLSGYSLSASSSELLEAIRYAQTYSMANLEKDFQVVSGGGDKYRVMEYLHASSTTQDVSNPLDGSSAFVANSSEWSGVSISALNLSFDTRGYPCNSAAPCISPMTSTQTIIISSAGESRTITIEPITGYAHAN